MTKKKNKIMAGGEVIVSPSGRPPTTGDTPGKFKSFLKSLDIDKEEWLQEAENNYPAIIDKIKARWLALQAYRATVDVVKGFYTDQKVEITLTNELIRLETDLARHIQLKQDDPAYSAIDDKNYIKAIALKKDLLESINKHNVNIAKLSVEAKKVDGDKESAIVWDME